MRNGNSRRILIEGGTDRFHTIGKAFAARGLEERAIIHIPIGSCAPLSIKPDQLSEFGDLVATAFNFKALNATLVHRLPLDQDFITVWRSFHRAEHALNCGCGAVSSNQHDSDKPNNGNYDPLHVAMDIIQRVTYPIYIE